MTTYPTIILIGHLYRYYNLQYVTATIGGVHAPNSWHYKGDAVDFGSGVQNAAEVKAAGTTGQASRDSFAAWWYQHPYYLTELVHTKEGDTGGWYVKNGIKVPHGYYGTATDVAHENHNHVAIALQEKANQLLTVRVQELLNLRVDGINGPKTVAAVKAFQKKANLTADGRVGSLTVAALRAAQGWKKV